MASHGSSFQKVFLGAAGSSAGGAGLDVDEVFSTYLYEGTSANRSIVNGIDLSGEGGLVWTKVRTQADSHYLFDTERGVNKRLSSNATGGQQDETAALTAFNSNGFSLGNATAFNGNAANWGSAGNYVSWTFRKAPKFFDVVTYTGNGSAGRQIAHNLGTTVGMLVVKSTSHATSWKVQHRSTGATNALELNDTRGSNDVDDAFWNDTAASSTHFTVGDSSATNSSGRTYVAYLFAHNDGDGTFGPDGNADIISCGSVNANSTFTLPWQPQWILSKDYNRSYDWHIIDSMRGFTASGNADNYLEANNTNAEQTAGWFDIDGNTLKNRSGGNIIYVAIRRGPLTVPTDATKVFAIDTRGSTGDGAEPAFRSAFPVDFALNKIKNSETNWTAKTRLLGAVDLKPNATNAESGANNNQFDYMNGHFAKTDTDANEIDFMWKRAPSYFDVVHYKGTGSARTVSHNLGAVPEMMWVKMRNEATGWMVYHSALGNTKAIRLDENSTPITSVGWWNNTTPTASVFSVEGAAWTNDPNDSFIAYLFATVAGVSKVGSYTGDGSTSKNIECGFSNGSRWVLIKRTDNDSDWFVFDSVRGINSGTEPRLELNNTDDEPTATDQIDPYSGGFNLASQSSFNINISDASYIFYAIA